MTLRTSELSVFARRLAQARTQAGLSQKQLGLLAGLDPAVASPRINQYERGKHEPQQKTAKQLADALGVPPAFLYTDDDLLALLLLRWGDLSVRDRREVVRAVEAAASKREVPKTEI